MEKEIIEIKLSDGRTRYIPKGMVNELIEKGVMFEEVQRKVITY